MIRRLWSRLGLRARITGLYALGGLLLSLTIALSTLTLARQNLVEDREERAFSVAVRNAQRAENGLGAETEIEDVGVLLDNLTITEGSFPCSRSVMPPERSIRPSMLTPCPRPCENSSRPAMRAECVCGSTAAP